MVLSSSVKNMVHEWHDEMPNDFRLKILVKSIGKMPNTKITEPSS